MIGRRVARVLGQAERKLFPKLPVILIYHRVNGRGRDLWGITTDSDRFSEQIEALKSVRRVVSVPELAKAAAARRTADKPLAAITFDDGYADVFTDARPILERLDCPSTLFVATDMVDAKREFWWDELAYVFLEAKNLPSSMKLRFKGGAAVWRLERPDDFPGVRHELRRRFRDMPADEIEDIMAQIRDWAKIEPLARPENRAISSAEAAQLKGGLMSLGAHTARHPSMPSLDLQGQCEEVDKSRRACEALVGERVETFAYPFGHYDAASVKAVRRSGFSFACTTVPSTVGPWRDPLRLPRIAPGQMDGEALIKALG
jgi:peptidoglycan/xylan/chitin deacetylase (PgdA/CDA1 family)